VRVTWPFPLHSLRYCRFFLGRRSEDDARQIGRFNQVMGPTGRFRTNLMNQIVRKGKRFDDVNVSPVIRQTLQHWGYRLTEVNAVSTEATPDIDVLQSASKTNLKLIATRRGTFSMPMLSILCLIGGPAQTAITHLTN